MKPFSNISFSDIGSIPLPVKDFLNDNLSGFKENRFSLENFKNQISSKEKSFTQEQRNVLFEVLSDQLSGLELSEKQHENLHLLKERNTFTVVTGHQLNLFSGPSFFVYKILQTIKIADFLKENFPNHNFVPIFWLASEDHDFEEINHFKTREHYYEIHGKSGGAVGRINIEDQFFITRFKEEFKDSVYGTELIRWIEEAYKIGNTLTQATKILVNRLFSEFGLLMIDGDDKRLKVQMKETFKDELLNKSLFENSKNKVNYLEEKYGKVQVNPREINLFYLSETRDRIDFQNGKYFVLDKNIQFTEEEILAELKNHPEKFSPNALMRPVYQETVLPNLAYIGGNAEIMYWFELKDYFKNINIPFPVLIPRNSMLFVEEKQLSKIQKLNLKLEDFFGNFAEVIKRNLLEDSELSVLIDEKETEIKSVFTQLKDKSSLTDRTFRNLVEAEETRQLKSYEKMRKRLLRAEKIKQSEKLERMENLFLAMHPGKIWQERVFNFSVFYSDFGRSWLQTCYTEMSVDKSELIIIAI